MPTTSNFGWTTPADTDLVKDGAAAIRTLGNGIDTSLVDLKGGTTGQNLRKASNTDLDFTFAGDATNTVVDAAGDLLYGTASDTLGRLAIGTAGQVLKVNSGATAPEWGAAASGALTLISRQSFSNVASATMDNVFSSTYTSYEIIIESMYAATTADDLQMILRYGTTDGTVHYGNLIYNAGNSTTWVNIFSNNTTQFVLSTASTAAYPFRGVLDVTGVGTSTRPFVTGSGLDGQTDSLNLIRGYNDSAQTYTGFKLKSASSNITATVAVYGKAQ